MILAFFLVNAQSDRAIFLHHSTGGGVWGGGVEDWITNFNSGNITNYFADEYSYPNTPWGWENYPYDFWKLWVGGSCNNDTLNIACVDYFAARNELIIIKHCFPGAGIGEDSGDPDVTSSEKTLGNYKAQYRALRDMMDGMPNTKFMFWTLAPLHRNATDAATAARAYEFVQWVNNNFLTEDSKVHPNIYIFDFYSLVAELSASPANGQQYCLKYDYEGDHEGSDSHPNDAANKYVAPLFGRAIVNALGNTIPIIIDNVNDKTSSETGLSIMPNPNSGSFSISVQQELTAPYNIDVVSVDGKIVKRLKSDDSDFQVTGLEQGMYYVNLRAGNANFVEPIIVK